MGTQHPEIRKIRAVIKPVQGAWIRHWRDGTFSAGIDLRRCFIGTQTALGQLKDVLTKNGYRWEQNGKPGTSGADVLDVFLPEQ